MEQLLYAPAHLPDYKASGKLIIILFAFAMEV
jgi:hypothetical protein